MLTAHTSQVYEHAWYQYCFARAGKRLTGWRAVQTTNLRGLGGVRPRAQLAVAEINA